MSLIQVKELYKSFILKDRDIQEVISNVNFSVSKGETFVIIGPNGSGKSTLLKILALIEPVSKGSIIYNNIKINELSNSEKVKFRRKISFVRQKPVVLNTSVYHNVE